MNEVIQYRCYVKDQLNLTSPPKCFMRVDSFNTKEDYLTSANSTITVIEIGSNVNEGDVLVLYDRSGTVLYNGVIKSIADNKITCTQMQSFYKGTWIYEKGETFPTSYNNSWYFERFSKSEREYPEVKDFSGLSPISTNTYNDNNLSTSLNVADNYSGKATTYVWCERPIITTVNFITSKNGTITLNGDQIAEVESEKEKDVKCNFVKGMNELIVCYNEETGNDGWKMYLSHKSFSVYETTKAYKSGDYVDHDDQIYRANTNTNPEAWNASHWAKITAELKLTSLPYVKGLNSTKPTERILEKNIYNILKYYSEGYLVGCDYKDTLINQRLGGFELSYIGSTEAELETKSIGSTMDMEKFFYELYDKYSIIIDFDIRYSGTNYVTVKTKEGDPVKVGNNIYAIKDLSPITTIEEKNKLVIFSSDKTTYRDTYVATRNEIVKEPTSIANRFELTNTVIVYSDDEIDDIISANLPEQMYNHKLTFSLVLKNKVYSSSQFVLGMPIDVWYGTEYFSSILTGREIKKASNQNVTEINYTCGKVRTRLTQLLSQGKI